MVPPSRSPATNHQAEGSPAGVPEGPGEGAPLTAQVEAVLFVAERPVSVSELARLLRGSPDSVEGAAAGTQILAKELTLPSGTTLLADEELLIVNVTEQVSAEALEAELAEAEAEAGIEHDPSDDEIAEAQEEAKAEDAAQEAGDSEGSSDSE